jgi:hypothetical protein
MTELRRRDTDRGIFISAETNRGGVISAHYGRDRSNDRPFTIYWRGRTNFEQLREFFDKTLPKHVTAVNATLFGASERLRFDRLRTPDELSGKLPAHLRFVRLECKARPTEPSMDNLEYIVWSRVDLGKVPLTEPAPDNIGVFLTPAHFHEVRERLLQLFVSTNVYHADSSDAGDTLHLLEPLLLEPGNVQGQMEAHD